MSERVRSVDVAVVGAGSAGAASAYCLAKAGYRVALVDQQPFDRAGARWSNGLPPQGYDFAGIPRPEPPEVISRDFGFVVAPALSVKGFRVSPQPLWNVNMRLHVRRLQALCREEGVICEEGFRLREVRFSGERPVEIVCERVDSGPVEDDLVVRARLFVDAGGMRGPLRSMIPELARDCPPVAREHICTAMQEECEVLDREAAARFVRLYSAQPGDAIAIMGVDGGFSTFTLYVSADFRHVGCLAGAIADGRHATGPQLMARLKREQPWIGPSLYGGAGLIPLRRPYDRLAAGGVALVGDAACQVLPASGSGIVLGMQAARLLTDAVRRFDDPGSLEATWEYQTSFQRKFGADLAGFDLFRRLSQSLEADGVARMIESHMMNPGTFISGLHQVLKPPPLGEFPALVRGAWREPRVVKAAAPLAAKVPLLQVLYRNYPARPDRAALARWSRRVAALFGETPDLRE